MNTNVPVRLPVCHMHANVYLEAKIHIYKRTYVCTHTDRRTYAYGLMDRQTDAPVPACPVTNCYAN